MLHHRGSEYPALPRSLRLPAWLVDLALVSALAVSAWVEFGPERQQIAGLNQAIGQADIGNQPLLGGGAERNPNITVRELLDRAAKAIQVRFADQPLTEAAICLTVGRTYYSLGRFTESEPHLTRSMLLRATQLGADHPDTLSSKNEA